jgi:hypothetical protein
MRAYKELSEIFYAQYSKDLNPTKDMQEEEDL